MPDGSFPSNKYRFELPDGNALNYAVIGSGERPVDFFVVLGKDAYAGKFPPLHRSVAIRDCRAFILELPNQGESFRYVDGRNHVNSFGDLIGMIDYFYKEIVEPSAKGRKIVGLGHSMGGHLMLRWEAEHLERRVNANVLLTPMMDFTIPPVFKKAGQKIWGVITKPFTGNRHEPEQRNAPPERAKRRFHGTALAGIMIMLGRRKKYALGEGDYNPDRYRFEENPNTTNEVHFINNKKRLEDNPALANGGITNGWYLAAVVSFWRTRRRNYFKDMQVPILVVTATDDVVTPAHIIMRYFKGMKNITHRVLKNARHDVLAEPLLKRQELWQKIIEPFLIQHNVLS